MAISLKELSERIASSMPVGTIIAYYGNDQPSGWLICDGRSCSGTDLSSKLGINNVPDLRGRFIRMIGGNAAGMAVAQGDLVGPHTHTGTLYGGSGYTTPNTISCWDNAYVTGRYEITHSEVETRPINMAFNFIIKAMGNAKSLYYKLLVYNIYNIIAILKSYFISVIFILDLIKQEMRYDMIADNLYYKLSDLLTLENTRNILISCVSYQKTYKEVRI